jgi:hypothetical protein
MGGLIEDSLTIASELGRQDSWITRKAQGLGEAWLLNFVIALLFTLMWHWRHYEIDLGRRTQISTDAGVVAIITESYSCWAEAIYLMISSRLYRAPGAQPAAYESAGRKTVLTRAVAGVLLYIIFIGLTATSILLASASNKEIRLDNGRRLAMRRSGSFGQPRESGLIKNSYSTTFRLQTANTNYQISQPATLSVSRDDITESIEGYKKGQGDGIWCEVSQERRLICWTKSQGQLWYYKVRVDVHVDGFEGTQFVRMPDLLNDPHYRDLDDSVAKALLEKVGAQDVTISPNDPNESLKKQITWKGKLDMTKADLLNDTLIGDLLVTGLLETTEVYEEEGRINYLSQARGGVFKRDSKPVDGRIGVDTSPVASTGVCIIILVAAQIITGLLVITRVIRCGHLTHLGAVAELLGLHCRSTLYGIVSFRATVKAWAAPDDAHDGEGTTSHIGIRPSLSKADVLP